MGVIQKVEVPLRSLFETPTVAGLAQSVEAAQRAGDEISVPPLEPVAREGELPLSFSQERLWFLDQLEPNSSTYNISRAVRLRNSLNVEAFEQSLTEIVRRHESLRTTFPAVDGRPVQIIAPPSAVSIPVIDLSQLSDSECKAEVRRLTREERQRPIDLARGPLWRVMLLRLGVEEHVRLLTMHHIITDGWSMGVFQRELSVLYRAFSRGKASSLSELPIQYADYGVWQRQWLEGAVLKGQLKYWKEQLAGAPPVLKLPTDRARPAVQSYREGAKRLRLSAELSQALRSLSQWEEVTLFMTLLAAFKVLLCRYTGQEDILVGTPVAGRSRAETEGLIGFFVNVLVMRTDMSGDPSFRELLGRVRKGALEAYAHQDLPFEKLVEELQPERSLSHTPLFQVFFNMLKVGEKKKNNRSRLTLDALGRCEMLSKFDLTLNICDGGKKFWASLAYNADLFEGATIARMLGHYQVLLGGIIADPEQRLSDLPILTAREHHQLLKKWNGKPRAYPQDQVTHTLIEAQAERKPDAVALICGEARLSYRELNRRANQLAHYLRAQGVGPEVMVGISMGHSLEVVIGILGILKARGCYVPLDPDYPKERLVLMLEETLVTVLLTQESLLKRLPEHTARRVCVDRDREMIARESEQNPVSQTALDNLAFVPYTSGSTGRPKGVLGLHRALVNRSIKEQSFKGGNFVFHASLNWVASSGEIFMPLLHGKRLIIIPDEIRHDVHRLVHTLAEKQVKRISLVPSHLRLLLDTYKDLRDRLPVLRFWGVRGEALTDELSQRFHEQMPQCKLTNHYGTSEVRTSDFNTETYVLDSRLLPLPIGVLGEVYLDGDGLARCYLKRPELTAEKFIPNPFCSEPGARLFKTGDLGRYLPNGELKVVGRLDHQVKIRGIRIELGEIEAVLSEHPAVHEAVIMAREDTRGDKYLAAYVVPVQLPAPTRSELRNYLREKLPSYMIPSAFMLVDALPLTPNGKIDRRALPAPDQNRPELEETFVAARTLVEEALAGIWADVLGLEHVGIYDDFFALGGDSLLASRLMARVRAAFQMELPLRRLFETLTVASLAQAVEAACRTRDDLKAPPLKPVARGATP